MKYFFSWAVWWLLMRYLRNDLPYGYVEAPYGNYHIFWQIMGCIYPVGGIVIFILGAIFCTTREDFEHDIDKAMAGIRQDETIKDDWKKKEAELTAIN